jgi:hypothetical protein
MHIDLWGNGLRLSGERKRVRCSRVFGALR